MRLNIISTIWITCLTLVSLLMSGFASGSAMDHSVISERAQISSLTCQSHSGSSYQHHVLEHRDALQEQGQCDVKKDKVDGCCHIVCAPVAAIFVAPDIHVIVNSSFALLPSPFSGEVINRLQNLDRPPRA